MLHKITAQHIVLGLGGFVLLLGLFFFIAQLFYTKKDTHFRYRSLSELTQKIIEVDGDQFTVFASDTPELRQLGLSHVERLGAREGMIFVFDEPGTYGFWMKDMFFDLDIIWLDADGRIVHIYENITPETYPTVFRPLIPALYVLEFPAGWVREYGLAAGDVISILE
ncbi:MAG: DUF192 domain-containing protein [Candidatus Pacebacteria bacterium]|nr:DUF192 domain-containing protein [Candidatus Paceibacterota bacterium]MCD8564023.1 DUF192 domain-containing protein [Candidatus Paceibacterota bacterium]